MLVYLCFMISEWGGVLYKLLNSLKPQRKGRMAKQLSCMCKAAIY